MRSSLASTASTSWPAFLRWKPVARPDDLRALKLFSWAGDTEAVEHLTKAEASVGTLADDGYGRMIRGAIERLRAELIRDH